MNPLLRSKFSQLGLVCLAFFLVFSGGAGEHSEGKHSGRGGRKLEPGKASPVDYMRRILAAGPEERAQLLEGRSDRWRSFILEKVAEYESLPEDVRESRLLATQIRYYMRPLIGMTPEDRAPFFEAMSEGDRTAIQSNLKRWDALPDADKVLLLDHERSLSNFLRLERQSRESRLFSLNRYSEEARKKLESDIQAWQALPEEQRRRMFEHFLDFFEMTEKARENALDYLPEAKRKSMESVMEEIQAMPATHRQDALEGARKFGEMTPSERARFLIKAENWLKLSEEERAALRRLAYPPMPPTPMPPLPPVPLPPLPPMPK